MTSPRFALALIAVLLVEHPAMALEDLEVVEVRVTAVAGASVYLDAGRLAGIAVGDRVRLLPPGAVGPVDAVVRSVSATSSRVELSDGSPAVRVGDAGEVLVPSARLDRAPEESADTRQPVEHPSWNVPAGPWDPTRPLLATPSPRASDELPVHVGGQVFFALDPLWDHERDARYLLMRQGAQVSVENPFGRSGELALDIEAFRRETHVADFGDDTDSRVRLDRFSWSEGGTRERALRFEAGRFLHSEFPELGVLDGIELVQRTESGARFGASTGFMPEPLSDFRTGDDFETALFWASPSERDLEFGFAYQSTWHEGDHDRDLLVGDVSYHPGDRLRLNAAAWVDHYGGGDTIKSDGLELTELRVDGTYRISERSGAGARVAAIRWPELLREEFTSLTPDQIRDRELRRAGISVWRQLGDVLRADARVDAWEDDEDDGTSGDVRLSTRDWWASGSNAGLTVFASDGSFTSAKGVRLDAGQSFAPFSAHLLYELASFEQEGFVGALEDLVQHRIRLQGDVWRGPWTLSLYVEERVGDEQDALAAGIFARYGF